MDVRIRPHALAGAVTPPPSKSMAHRLLLAAALADGVSTVKNVALSQDIEATLRCMAALGASWERTDKSTLRVTGIGGKEKSFPELPRFDCGESGSTLRFLIPIALAVAGGGVFTGRGRLMERPQKPYFDLFDEKGISYEQTAGALTVRGTLTPGEYRLAGIDHAAREPRLCRHDARRARAGRREGRRRSGTLCRAAVGLPPL